MRPPQNKNVPSHGFPSTKFDRPDGFHNLYGPMNAGTSLARVLNDRSDTALAEETDRLRRWLVIDVVGIQHGFADITTERRREISNAYDQIAGMGRPE